MQEYCRFTFTPRGTETAAQAFARLLEDALDMQTIFYRVDVLADGTVSGEVHTKAQLMRALDWVAPKLSNVTVSGTYDTATLVN